MSGGRSTTTIVTGVYKEGKIELTERPIGIREGRVRVIVTEEAETNPAPAAHTSDVDNDATIALLDSWLREDATNDPEEIRKAEADLCEFKRNMNAPRKENGERLLFPEVE